MKMNKTQLKEAVKAVVRECLNERVIKEVSPPGKKAERMIQHVKSSLRQSHPDWDEEKVTSVAIATGWKAHNKGSVEEAGVQGADSKVSVLDVIVRLIMKRVPAYKGNPDKITKAAAYLFRLQYGKPADMEAVQQAVERNLGYGDQIQDTPASSGSMEQDECGAMEQEGAAEVPQGMEGGEEGEHAYDEREEIKLIKVMALIAKKLEAMHAGMPGDEVDPSAECPAAAEEPSEPPFGGEEEPSEPAPFGGEEEPSEEPSEPAPFGGGEEEPSEEPSEKPEPKKKEKKDKKAPKKDKKEKPEKDEEPVNEARTTLPPHKGQYKVVAPRTAEDTEENKALAIQTDPKVNENEEANTLPPDKGQYKTVAPHQYTTTAQNKPLTIQTDPKVNEAGLTSEKKPDMRLSSLVKESDWIKGAVKHPGRCAHPGSKECPVGSPQYTLAQRFKKGDIHKANTKKEGIKTENHKVQTRSFKTANDLAQDPNIVRDPEVPGP